MDRDFFALAVQIVAYTVGYLVVTLWSRKHMSPAGRIWQNLTWSWAYSTGHPASDQSVEAAAEAAWSYAVLCAWTYLNDHEAAHDLMDQALQNVANYVTRHPETSTKKLTGRIKSTLRRLAKQNAANRSRERSLGSLRDLQVLEKVYFDLSDAEQKLYADEVLKRLSPFAQSVVKWRWLGYSWREIADQIEMDHTSVRRAYFREVESVLHDLSQSGEIPRCS